MSCLRSCCRARVTLTALSRFGPTPILDTYWRFATERQNIFFRRYEGQPGPWTQDPVLLKHKFTNVYRASDRVSQYLIREVIYKGVQTPNEWFFRTILFKIFNKIETWECLVARFGIPTWESYEHGAYTAALTKQKAKEPIYSAAYMMPQPALGADTKHENHLFLLEKMMRDELPYRLIVDCPDMEDAYEKLLSYPSVGPFLAYQYVIDPRRYTSLPSTRSCSTLPPHAETTCTPCRQRRINRRRQGSALWLGEGLTRWKAQGRNFGTPSLAWGQ